MEAPDLHLGEQRLQPVRKVAAATNGLQPWRFRASARAAGGGQEGAGKGKNLALVLLVQEFEKRQTEGPKRRTTPNVTNGPVPTGLLYSIFTLWRVGTELLSQALR